MNVRTSIVLACLVLIFGSYLYFIDRDQDTTAERAKAERRIFDLHAEAVEYVRIDRKEGRIECVKVQGNRWMLKSPKGASANGPRVYRLLKALETLEKAETIPENEVSAEDGGLARYGLEEPAIRLSFGTELVDHTLLIGNYSPSGTTLYVKDQALPEVYVVRPQLMKQVPAGLNDLREHQVFAGKLGSVRKIEMQRADGFMQIERDPQGKWMMLQPVPGEVDQTRMQALEEKLIRLQVEAFISDGSELAPEYGFSDDSPFVKVWFSNDEFPTKLILGKAVDEDSAEIFARVEQVESVFTILRGLEHIANTPAFELLDAQLVPLDKKEIQQIRIAKGEKHVLLSLQPTGWQIMEPLRSPADPRIVDYILEDWTQAESDEFLSTDVAQSLVSSNSVPVFALTFSTTTNAVESTSAEEGVEVDEAYTYNFYSITQDTQRVVFHEPSRNLWGMASGNLFRYLSGDALHFRNRNVLQLVRDDVVRITQVIDGRTITVNRKVGEEEWKSADEPFDPDPLAITALLGGCAPLTARKFVEADPRQLGPYGLDQARIRVTFGLSGKTGIGRTLLIGNGLPNGDRYGMILGQDLVFMLRSNTLPFLLQPVGKVIDKEPAEGDGRNETENPATAPLSE
jgi:hypothetical protein